MNRYPEYSSPYGQPHAQPYGQPYGGNFAQNGGHMSAGPHDYNRNMAVFDQHKDSLSGDLASDARRNFIKKVYTLLSIQLVITTLVCLWAMNSPSFRNIFGTTPALIILSVLLIATSCVIACCTDFVRKYGLPVLIVFTLIMAIFVGTICAVTKSSIVLTAAAITAAVVIGLTLFACFTKTDFTGCGPYLFVISLVLLIFGIVCIFWRNPIAHLVYSCIAALLFAIYFVFDTQMVLGRGQMGYTLDDAYLAAIQLYTDVIQIFLQVLNILSYASN